MNELGLTDIPPGSTVYKSVGCPACSKSGYAGRTVIHELLIMNDDIRSLIIKNADSSTVKKKAVEHGMITLREDGVHKVLSGMTTVDELMRATHAEV
jgi:type II secretory ATPase GspE/PulE/Tfp pilus assembly ATPase PilB-like protein